MAKETKIGKLIFELEVKTAALESGLKVAQNKLKEIEDSNKKIESSNKSVDASWIAVAATATATLAVIKSVISSAVDEYKSYTQAMESLADVSDYTNQNMSDMSKVMSKYSSIMNKSDIATTIKNFSLMGMSVEETDKMIQALTNSAIRNRNANYTVSEAVRVASEGYRQGLSTLSDSAGVTENLSVMLDNYAASLGKTASELTESEKNQAYLNRTMYAAEPFAGAMEGYLDGLAGKQGLYAQSMRDTRVAFAESLEPIFLKVIDIGTRVTTIIGEIIKNNKDLTAGVSIFGVVMISLITIIKLAQKSMSLLNAEVLKNPWTLVLVGISSLIAAFSTYYTKTKELKEAQSELADVTDRYNKIKEGQYGYTEKDIKQAENDKAKLEEQINNIQMVIELQDKLNEIKTKEENDGPTSELSQQYYDTKKELDDAIKIADIWNIRCDMTSERVEKLKEKQGELNKELQGFNTYLDDANTASKIRNAMDTEAPKLHQKEAAQLKVKASTMQSYLDIVKKGDKNISGYKNAVEELSKAYPEAVNAEGIIIDSAQDYINAEQAKADQAWSTSQEQISSNLKIVESYIDITKAAEGNSQRQAELASFIGISYENIIPTLSSVKNILSGMINAIPENVPGVKPTILDDKTYTTSSSYSNEALDNYKRQIEHKKALDQITLKEEIAMYETALREYANTADEKMELREKIYELNKELAKKEKEILEQQTEDYENYIQEQKNLRGAAYDVLEQTRDYDKIIRMHKNYLDQIMKDERLSLEERKEIYREELQTIREYEQQKRDLRVEAVDNTVSQLTNAITKQLEEAQKKDKEAIDKNLEEVEKWKNARIDAINEEYDARIEAINKELDALNKAEEQKSRDEEDAEFERKKLRLEQLIAYEHDATTKANYQKELDKLVAEYQKTLDARALQDKKDALNEQKELLQKEQDDMTQAIEDEADKQKEVYDKQLEDLEKYYEEQIDMAQETAEKMLLNVSQNQDKILNLLKSYGDKYEITGQTLGEKLAQGLNNGLMDKVQSVVQKIQDTIDANLNAKIKEWSSSNYLYESGVNKPQITSQTINITQQNYIEQNPEMPSETYRKLNDVSQKLASELSGK